MSKKNQHVVMYGDQWAIRDEGNGKYTFISDTQSKAFERARDVARNQESELLIDNRHGQIQSDLVIKLFNTDNRLEIKMTHFPVRQFVIWTGIHVSGMFYGKRN